jgi:HK97 family phage prohead protease
MSGKIEHKLIEFKIDSEVDEEGVFKGIGSGLGDIDQGDDIVMPDAFNESLMKKTANQIKCLWQHNQTEPMGYYRSLVVSGQDLMVEGKILPTTLGKDALILMKGDDQGKGVDGLSIGFRVQDYEFKTIEGRRIRLIKKADLIEISVVTFPMHLRCRIQGVKSMTVEQITELKSLSDIEDALRDNGFSKNASTALISKVSEFKKNLSDESESQKNENNTDESDSQKIELEQKELEEARIEEKAEIGKLSNLLDKLIDEKV